MQHTCSRLTQCIPRTFHLLPIVHDATSISNHTYSSDSPHKAIFRYSYLGNTCLSVKIRLLQDVKRWLKTPHAKLCLNKNKIKIPVDLMCSRLLDLAGMTLVVWVRRSYEQKGGAKSHPSSICSHSLVCAHDAL